MEEPDDWLRYGNPWEKGKQILVKLEISFKHFVISKLSRISKLGDESKKNSRSVKHTINCQLFFMTMGKNYLGKRFLTLKRQLNL